MQEEAGWPPKHTIPARKARKCLICSPTRNGRAAKSERSLNDGRFRFRMPGAIDMAVRAASRRRWFLRDVPRTYVLFVWLAFGLAIFLYAYDWRPSGWSPAVAGLITARGEPN